MKNSLPAAFCDNTEKILGATESKKLFAALETDSPTSIRFNPYKLSERPEGRAVAWSRYGFYLDRRPVFTLDPLFHGGVYYVQEASSMFIEHIYRQCFPEDGGAPGAGKGAARSGGAGSMAAVVPRRVLDLCAAPGGKTTLLSTMVGTEGLVVANEVIRSRAAVLADNVKKWGIGNVVVTNNDPSHFSGFGNYFDMVLVDAPCSGEGMFRKDEAARREWSESGVKLCAARGRRILSDIIDTLRPGGFLIYSTCTFNTVENEENIKWLVDNYGLEPVGVDADPSWGIVRGDVAGVNTFRFYPHKVDGEGFFAAVMRKADGRGKQSVPKPRKSVFAELSRKDAAIASEWVNQPEFMRFAQVGENIYGYYGNAFGAVKELAETLTVIYSGVALGQIFGGKLKPEHPLALFHDLARGKVPEKNLDNPQILDYLRKNDINPELFEEGINMVCFNGLPLGWAKRIGHRVNNMYPKELRITNL